jgi:SP family general alpha glucoside:H+ symporter-like MFS transporter
MMQQLNEKHPNDYLIAMRVLWAPIGAMILFWVIVPESPWFHARRGNKDAAMKSMRQLYGNIEAYDFEEEYGIIAHTIEHENLMLANRPRYRDLFVGINKVRLTLHVE